MFRVKDGKLKVFSKYTALRNGTHTVYVDAATGSVSYSGEKAVVSYTFDELSGELDIQSHLEDMGGGSAPTKARSWMNGRKISSGPLYGESLGVGGREINVYLEGFAFDFDYNGVAHAVAATKPFRWTGGRVCFQDMLGNGGGLGTQGKYTAIPAAGSCGQAFIQDYETGVGQIADIASIYGGGAGGLLSAAGAGAMEFYGNSVSVVFSYRSFRKYLSWARGLTGIFECSLGAIGASSGSVEPDGAFPDVFDGGFRFSMFNLRQ